MDATKRPLMIPPEFATYAEQHGVFEMYKVGAQCFVTYIKLQVIADRASNIFMIHAFSIE